MKVFVDIMLKLKKEDKKGRVYENVEKIISIGFSSYYVNDIDGMCR